MLLAQKGEGEGHRCRMQIPWGTRCNARSSSRIFILQSAPNGLTKISRISSIFFGGPEFRAHRQGICRRSGAPEFRAHRQCYDAARHISMVQRRLAAMATSAMRMRLGRFPVNTLPRSSRSGTAIPQVSRSHGQWCSSHVPSDSYPSRWIVCARWGLVKSSPSLPS